MVSLYAHCAVRPDIICYENAGHFIHEQVPHLARVRPGLPSESLAHSLGPDAPQAKHRWNALMLNLNCRGRGAAAWGAPCMLAHARRAVLRAPRAGEDGRCCVPARLTNHIYGPSALDSTCPATESGMGMGWVLQQQTRICRMRTPTRPILNVPTCCPAHQQTSVRP